MRLFGPPLAAGVKIKERIKEQLHLAATIGIAPNKTAAKIASAHAKPDGLLEITTGNLFSFLWPLPVSKMFGVGEQTGKVLIAMGIQTIGDLARTPVAALDEHLGMRGRYFWDLANGIDGREVVSEEEAKSVSHEHTFEKDTADREQLETVLSILCEKVSRRLRSQGLKGKTVTLKVRFSDFKTITRDVTLPERTNFFDAIYTASRLLFDASCVPTKKYRLIAEQAPCGEACASPILSSHMSATAFLRILPAQRPGRSIARWIPLRQSSGKRALSADKVFRKNAVLRKF